MNARISVAGVTMTLLR